MKKIIFFSVMFLLLVAPAWGAIVIKLEQVGDTNEVRVIYDMNGEPNRIRAFGLDVITSTGVIYDANWLKYNSKYQIFPGQIDINASGIVVDYGSPICDPCDLPAGTTLPGLDTNGVTIEMSSLYVGEANAPPSSGTLLSLFINSEQPPNISIVGNAARTGIGSPSPGVVMEDPNQQVDVIFRGLKWITQEFDFGDAPDTYPTLLASGGPSHIAIGPTLGANRDSEPDGQPSALCDLDDNTGVPDDEDGVTLINAKNPTGSVTVNVSAACLLNAWMDFNGDGDFADAGEQIFTNQALVAGNNNLNFPVPAVAKPSRIISRWRVNTAGGLSYGGPALDGEVEDYITECLAPTDPGYAAWISATWNRPRCWCYRRQCRGDINGIKSGAFWVASIDLMTFRAAFSKIDTELRAMPDGICADLNHIKSGPFRVQSLDLSIIRTYINKLEAQVPACDAAPIITGPYNFWTNSPN